MIDAIFDLRERDLAADKRFRKIAKLAGGLFALSLFNEDKADDRAICRNWVGDILAIVEDWKDKDTSLEDVLSDLEDLLDEGDDVRRGDLIKWIIRVVESTVDCDGLDIAAQVAKRPLYLERLEFDNEGRFIQAVLKEREDDSDE